MKASAVNITSYRSIFTPCFSKDMLLRIAIRYFEMNNKPYYLTVNPNTLLTEYLPITEYLSRRLDDNSPGYFTHEEVFNTKYVKLLKRYHAPPIKLFNHGITHSAQSVNGIYITIDMCPSTKLFERAFFEKLALLGEESKGVPVALCMSGLWMLKHPDEFNWLLELHEKNKINVTWVNHSFNHVYYSDMSTTSNSSKNALLSDGTNLAHEIFDTERLLIQHQQCPSVFFRAPGLLMNEELSQYIQNVALIPVGADAWLAKGEVPKNGSIILVHGNGNEPKGIEAMNQILNGKRILLLSLTDASLTNN